ncbi:TRAP transporter small permease subunit [bacterium LRH843]|nr:TRAP transporter small permease subunit [bacterium LRH843]
MQSFIRMYSRLCDWIERFINGALVITLAALIIVVSLQIFSRMMNASLLWTVDVGILLLIWSTLLATGIGIRKNSHFVIDLWPEHWKRWSTILTFLSLVTIMVLSVCFLIEGTKYVLDVRGGTSGMAKIPLPVLYSALPVGGFLILLFSIEQLLKTVSGKENIA